MGSQPEIGLGHRGKSTDSGSGLQLFRKEFPQRQSSEAGKVFIKRKRVQYVWIDTRADSRRVPELLSLALMEV